MQTRLQSTNNTEENLKTHQTIFNFFQRCSKEPKLCEEIIRRLRNDYDIKGIVPVADSSLQSQPLGIKEELIDLRNYKNPRLTSLPIELIKMFGLSDTDVRLSMRVGAFFALQRLLEYLPENLGIYVYEGYRSIEDQQQRFSKLIQKMELDHPEWSDGKTKEEASKLLCPVKNGVIPPHTTGGALDIFPFEISSGELLAMGFKQDWTKMKSAPFSDSAEITPQEKENRQILLRAATKAGLVNYTGEFWHYSIGDSYWAKYTDQQALYSGLQLEEAKQLTFKS